MPAACWWYGRTASLAAYGIASPAAGRRCQQVRSRRALARMAPPIGHPVGQLAGTGSAARRGGALRLRRREQLPQRVHVVGGGSLELRPAERAARTEVSLDRVHATVAILLQRADDPRPWQGAGAQQRRLAARLAAGGDEAPPLVGRKGALLDMHVHNPAAEKGVRLLQRQVIPAVVCVPGHADVRAANGLDDARHLLRAAAEGGVLGLEPQPDALTLRQLGRGPEAPHDLR